MRYYICYSSPPISAYFSAFWARVVVYLPNFTPFRGVFYLGVDRGRSLVAVALLAHTVFSPVAPLLSAGHGEVTASPADGHAVHHSTAPPTEVHRTDHHSDHPTVDKAFYSSAHHSSDHHSEHHGHPDHIEPEEMAMPEVFAAASAPAHWLGFVPVLPSANSLVGGAVWLA